MAVNQANILDSLDKICSELNIDEFFYDFLLAYGLPKSTVTRLRKEDDNRNVADGDGIALKKKIYFKKVSIGDDIEAIAEDIKSSNVIPQHDIRFVMVTDFQTLVAYDLKAEERLETTIEALPQQYAFFLPLAGYEKAIMHSEHPADIRASEKMGQLFDLIKGRNDLTTPEDIHALNVFLTRLLFCFYAEDTGIFAESQMTSAIQSSTQIDGSDLAQFFSDLFKVLNLDDSSHKRKDMPAHFQAFPYVNGGLFQTDEPIPEFGRQARRILIDCGSLDWSQINPDIFGSMFQAVIDAEQRGNLGQHYTSVSNIMKVIQPLFLDPLYEDLEKARNSDKKLQQLLVRLENIKIFDPACGSGNFLIIAYKELRKLEMEVIDALNATGVQTVMYYSGIRLSQFYGIEIDDFAHEVAILSLWLAEHQMNTAFKAKFGYADAALPLRGSGHIITGNSLRIDWCEVCPKDNQQGVPYEVYICGNPPFLGGKSQSASQKEDLNHVFTDIKNSKQLDLVAGWFFKAAEYIDASCHCAFVTTNSICQGAQVEQLWPYVFDSGVEISFCYKPFRWVNNAKNKAGVTVTIIGLSSLNTATKRIYSGNSVVKAKNINAYLIDAPDIFVTQRLEPMQNMPPMITGNSPYDAGFLSFTDNEKEIFLKKNPKAERFLRQAIGSNELIKGITRWCLWIDNSELDSALSFPDIKERVDNVREFRLKGGQVARSIAHKSHQFRYTNAATSSQIVIPIVSSEQRNYLPIGYLDSQPIILSSAAVIYDASLYIFGIINSTIHYDWMSIFAGRLESRFRYLSGLVYNTFPWPDTTNTQRQSIEALAEEVLLIREDYPDKTLADLYDPDKMPLTLLSAHKALDRAVEQLYRKAPFRDALERLEHLFARYEKLIAEEEAQAAAKKPREVSSYD